MYIYIYTVQTYIVVYIYILFSDIYVHTYICMYTYINIYTYIYIMHQWCTLKLPSSVAPLFLAEAFGKLPLVKEAAPSTCLWTEMDSNKNIGNHK